MIRIGTSLVNLPPRRWRQRYYEVPGLQRHAPPLPPDARVLEIGCGQGYALASRTYRLLFDHPERDRFTASQVLDACENRGLSIVSHRTRRRGRYLLGVATTT